MKRHIQIYEPDRGGAPDKPPYPASASDMIALTRLGGVEVGHDATLRLFYGFVEGAGWDDLYCPRWKPVGEDVRDKMPDPRYQRFALT